ncbi:HDOD domain-containing protein [Spongiibacter sp. KMU-158]|uniref:HDOD domain-containing protein n=1 Tax=Spongiibacter pelagi TaxID=2760804 RepID=A0A927GUX1_9GAMM|nr:HDOD domain-containing protein [Spongiibacter pelagi]MBD2857780.1 HDOD domain-containing protein [Spongiibacter pelagi]
MSAVHLQSHSDSQAQLLKRIAESIRDGSLELPSLPDIAIEVRMAIGKPDLDIRKLANLVQQDPGLTAYLMKISHSVIYSRGNPVPNLQKAISRLGLEATRELTMGYALNALFRINDPYTKRLLRDCWQRSVHTAALAHVIARHCGFDPERAMLAGLLQDIGALPILSNLKDYPELREDGAAIARLLREFTGKINGLILHKWEFDHELTLTALNRENWLRKTDKPADLTDLILVARYHTYLGEGQIKGLPKLFAMSAFERLGLKEADPTLGLTFLKEAEDEVTALRETLRG